MRRGWLVAMVATLFVGAACAAGPRLSVPELRYNFGLALDGDLVTHAFPLENLGDAPLSILDVVAECGCTAAELTTNPIPPGGRGELLVQFHTDGYGGATVVVKTISLATDDPAQPVVSLVITGSVLARDAVLVEPAALAERFALVVDLRDAAAYAAGHLAGAVHVPAAVAPGWIALLPPDLPLVVYDQDGSVSVPLAARLVITGRPHTRALAGGLEGWRRALGEQWITSAWPLVLDKAALP
jgi:rhodanese-related sulfurtransferase